VRGRAAERICRACKSARRHPASYEPRVAQSAIQPSDPHHAAVRPGGVGLSLARGYHPEADEGCRLRMGDWLLREPDFAGGSCAGPARGENMSVRLQRRINVVSGFSRTSDILGYIVCMRFPPLARM